MKRAIYALLTVCGFMGLYTASQAYTMDAVVCGYDNEEVYFEDNNGDVWAIYGDGYRIGEKVTLIMNKNFTPLHFDDSVKGVIKG